MRILFVCSGSTPGGMAPFIKSQGESLKKKGIELDYFTTAGRGFNGYLKSIGVLKRHLKENKYDIIHAHYALSGWVAVLARPRVPVVVSFMGCDVYGDVTADGKRTTRINIILAKLLQPFVRAIIVKSKGLAQYVYMKKKCRVIPNGVDFERFKPMDKDECRTRLKLSPAEKIVLFPADPADPRKNVRLAKEAVDTMKNPGINFLTPYPVDPADVPLYLNAADVVVLTSFLEGSPNVVKEAMACNRPVVATDVGDVEEVLADSEGCFITSLDPRDAADKLKAALDFDGPTFGRRAIAHLDETLIADRITAVYEQVKKN